MLYINLIIAYRGQLWKGKQNKIPKKKNEGNSNVVKLLTIQKYKKHLVIWKNDTIGASLS